MLESFLMKRFISVLQYSSSSSIQYILNALALKGGILSGILIGFPRPRFECDCSLIYVKLHFFHKKKGLCYSHVWEGR